MRNFAIILLMFAAPTVAVRAQTALPYYTAFDTPQQQQGWEVYRLGVTPLATWVISNVQSYSAPGSIYHGYPVGGTEVTDDWFVSPGFDFSAGGSVDSVRSNFSGFGVPSLQDTVAIYLLSGAQDPALASSQILLFDFRGSNYQNDNVWRLTQDIAIPPVAGQSFLAFRYKTVSNWLDVRFDNLQLSGLGVSVAPASVEARIAFHPNPTDGNVTVSIAGDGSLYGTHCLRVYNAAGVQVVEEMLSRSTSVNIGQRPGFYFYRLTNGGSELVKSGTLIVQ